MSLDNDAQAIADMLAEQMPGDFAAMGVDASRAFIDALGEQSPPGAPVHSVTNRSIPGPAGSIDIRVYRPSDRTDLPVLVYYHGGGWVFGSIDGVDNLCRELANRAECVVVSADYRLAPEHRFPGAIEDAYAAFEWVAAHGDELGVDSTRIAVGGDSAGANLAAVVSLQARDAGGPSIAFQLLAYPVTEYPGSRPAFAEHAHAPMLTADDTIWSWANYLGDVDTLKDDPRVAPMKASSLEGLPPAAVLSAEYDPLRDDGEAYAARLAESGVAVNSKRYTGVFHGFFQMVGMLAQTEAAIADASDLLAKALSTERSESGVS